MLICIHESGGEARKNIEAALRAADQYDDTMLKAMIKEGLARLK
jgi:cellobiose-specific phosphotransferase system component IIA